ncbi:hypothetical protein BHE74_00018647 [Ensete ventricosum]|nr:hypothetical protein GW17_00042873 [Ensete ventricosum]RWW73476.1 hypothetical protein BHE74_00018647 [Ensete ventricosum]
MGAGGCDLERERPLAWFIEGASRREETSSGTSWCETSLSRWGGTSDFWRGATPSRLEAAGKKPAEEHPTGTEECYAKQSAASGQLQAQAEHERKRKLSLYHGRSALGRSQQPSTLLKVTCKFEFQSFVCSPSWNFKILAIPDVLAHGKSFEHGFTRKYDGHKLYTQSRIKSSFDRFLAHRLRISKYKPFPRY